MVSEDSAHDLLERILHDANEEPIALPLSFLKSITNNFSDDQKIGSGGFATVYKGLLTNGTVAVKKLSQTLEVHEKEFNQEVDSLMRVKHTNIVRFLGYCADTQGKVRKYEGKNVVAEDRQRLLCLEFMPNGSLDKYISDGSGGLEWMTRYQLIRGICQGLNYLHQKKIVHLDLKPANILLDYCMVPKISDFGLSKCFDEKQTRAITSKCVGSQGYMAPEYFNGEITLKSDIYSLGVIIMEIVTGQKGYPDINNVLDSWSSRLGISRVDKRLEYVRVCLGIGIDCIDPNPSMRPPTWRIIEMLGELESSHGFVETDRCTSLAPQCLLRSMEAAAACVPCNFEKAATRHGPIEKAAQEIEEDLHNTEMRINIPISVFEKAAHQMGPNKWSVEKAVRFFSPALYLMKAYMKNPEKLFQERKEEFKDDAKLMKTKMHRYPPSIQALGDLYTVPKVVAIGPYYHCRDHLQKAEKMKHVAAAYCIQESKEVNNNSSLSDQDMYDAVVSVAAKMDARNLYDKDVMAGIGYKDDFLPMMFFDACFMVIYILRKSGVPFDADLYDFFEANDNDIAVDIMLLENQIPLKVVEAVMNMCTVEPLERMKVFIAMWLDDGFLQDRLHCELPRVDWNPDYYSKAPHLLGLLRFYAVGKRRRSTSNPKVPRPISAGAIELAEMGIFLTANETTELSDMGLDSKWIAFAKLSMAPLSLNDARARWLVSMAALELCTTPDFFEEDTAEFEDSAVCSYLLLLSMLMHREEDVHELRTKGILQGAGLNNNQTLDFFTSLHSLRKGRCYAHVMVEIQNYRNKRPWIKVYTFVYNNWKYILAVGFIGIIATVMSLKGGH